MTKLYQKISEYPLPFDAIKAGDVWQTLSEQCHDKPGLAPLIELHRDNKDVRCLLHGIFGNSPFLSQLALRRPHALFKSLTSCPKACLNEWSQQLDMQMKAALSLDEAMLRLRCYKQRGALLIALADISAYWGVEQVTEAITLLADVSLQCAIRYLLGQAASKGDYLPSNPEQPEQLSGYIALAMGKHGARELNYSSDIDLIILYDLDRISLRDGLEPSSFFIRLTRNLIKMMHEITGDGYVFRMDLRLRPDPGATQIALSTHAAFSYYESFGQNWERAAMIKARAVAGDIEGGEMFLGELRPFIWRKYLDFAAIGDVHAMKRQVHAFKGHGEIAVAGHNVKLGRGGIRDIEFFVQTQQLIAGGRQEELRARQTIETLSRLVRFNWIKSESEAELSTAYRFLRRIEHRLQMINDEQTHILPSDDEGLERISLFAGFKGADDFSTALKQQLEIVQSHYIELFEDVDELSREAGKLVFVGDDLDPDTMITLEKHGFDDPKIVIDTVKGWHFGRYPATRSERARASLTVFQPALLRALSETAQPMKALGAFDRFLSELPAGVQLFSLLQNNPNLLRLMANIVGTAPRLAGVLSRRANVLDAVLDPGFFGNLPDRDQLKHIIDKEFSICRDYQDYLDRARSIGQEQAFLIGVRILSGTIQANQAGRAYARLAENLISHLQDEVLNSLEAVHGTFANSAVSVVAMGKLGGMEMSASSDLDLIIVYDFDPGEASSNGAKPLTASQYFSRFTQRLIAALSAPTAAGELYDVDMRLRPSGHAGPVATSYQSFIDYQNNDAWVWEHMALTRARVLTGSSDLKQKINKTITKVLTTERDPGKLAENVVEIREKIAKEKATTNLWKIKQVAGGVVDLEFIAQYLQLAHGHHHPDILEVNTAKAFDNMVAHNVISPQIAAILLPAAKLYQTLTQILQLCLDKPFDPETTPNGLKILLATSVGEADFSQLEARLENTQKQVSKLYQEMVGQKNNPL